MYIYIYLGLYVDIYIYIFVYICIYKYVQVPPGVCSYVGRYDNLGIGMKPTNCVTFESLMS